MEQVGEELHDKKLLVGEGERHRKDICHITVE